VTGDAPPNSEVTGISLRLRHSERRDLGTLLEGWGYDVGRAWQAGDPRVTPKGAPLEGTWSDSYAYAKLRSPACRTLSAGLSAILEDLGPLKSDLQAFAYGGGRAELFVGWHFYNNSGDTLDWELLQRISEHRIDLALDIYPDRDWLEGVDLEDAVEDPASEA
jgi:hypothetical protein